MPSQNKYKQVYDRALRSFDNLSTFEKTVTIVGSIEPVTTIPQVYLVYSLKSAKELSLFTWGFGVFFTLLWLVYAISRKSWPLITSSILWLAVDIPIVIAIILYS